MLDNFELRAVRPSKIPTTERDMELNGIYSHGQLVATTGAYNHSGAADITTLVLAAPDLLEALKAIVPVCDNVKLFDQAIKAIAKAMGE